MKKIYAFIVGLAVLLNLVWFPFANQILSASAENIKTPIDMYLVAGQSNAAGCSRYFGSLSGNFTNVGYAGEIDRSYTTGIPTGQHNIDSYEQFLWSVKAGYGTNNNQIGPEYGMAEVLNDIYVGEKKAFIFKSAAGGTSLFNKENPHPCGNWTPRSMWAEGYDPSDNTNPLGYQYYSFMERFEKVYNELSDNGYAPKVKGMIWMQGENDLGLHVDYENRLKTFIKDIRADLADVTKDGTLEQMPFVIGKIATTFKTYNNSNVPAFNLMQQRVADSMTNVSTVETSDLIIVNQDGTNNGDGPHHFNYNDMRTLGQRFANGLLAYANLSEVNMTVTNGTVMREYDGDDNLVFTFQANTNYKLGSVVINGVDMTSQVANGKLTLKEREETMNVVATFIALETYRFTYEDLDDINGVFFNQTFQCREGETLKVKVYLPNGEKVLSVKLGETEMTYNNKTGYYEILPQADGHITVQIEGREVNSDGAENTPTDGTPEPPMDAPKETSSGCSGVVSGVTWLPVLGLAVLSLVLSLKNKKINK